MDSIADAGAERIRTLHALRRSGIRVVPSEITSLFLLVIALLVQVARKSLTALIELRQETNAANLSEGEELLVQEIIVLLDRRRAEMSSLGIGDERLNDCVESRRGGADRRPGALPFAL